MVNLNYFYWVLIIVLAVLGCQSESPTQSVVPPVTETIDNAGFVTTLEKHLRAVSEQDLVTLESTLSPKGDMILILPQDPLRTKVSEFMDFHRAWFQDTTWTFETKIISTDVQPNMGIAIVESVYREPERDGKPYFNRMHISYALRKMDGQWYVVKDHACSIEKSTDQK